MVTVWFVVRVYRGGSRRIALLRLVKEKKKKKEKFSRNLESSFPKSWQVKTAKKIEKRRLKVKKALEYRPFRRDSSQLRTLVPLITGV